MKLERRNFIKIGSVATASLALLGPKGSAAILIDDLPGVSSTGPADLAKNFVTPPDASKSSCYWWWFNGLVDKEGITRDMDEFKSKGMGEVLLVNSAGGLGGVPFPQGAKFMSEEWKELYRHAMRKQSGWALKSAST